MRVCVWGGRLRFNYQQHTHTFGTANITVRALRIMCIIFSPLCPPYVGPCQSRLKVFSNIKVSALGKIKVLRRWEKNGNGRSWTRRQMASGVYMLVVGEWVGELFSSLSRLMTFGVWTKKKEVFTTLRYNNAERCRSEIGAEGREWVQSTWRNCQFWFEHLR